MMDVYIMFLAGALIYCGYLLGRDAGIKVTMSTLFETNLLTPEQVVKHYEKLGYKRKKD